jgi:lysophospholipid acyltransferase
MSLGVYTPLELIGPVIARLAPVVGIPADQLRYVFALVASVPLAWVLRALHGRHVPLAVKHAASLACGLQLMWFLYGWETLHSLFSGLAVWVCMRWLPPRRAYQLAVAFSFAYITLAHMYKMCTDYMGWSPDFTAPQMVVSIKMISYAFSVHDGWLLANSTDATAAADVAASGLTERQRHYAIVKQPDVLAFLGWAYLSPGILGGPAIEYRDYERFVDESMFAEVPGRRIPSCKAEACKAIAAGLCFMAGIAAFGAYSPARLRRDVVDSAVAATLPLWWMLLLMYLSAVYQRFKYYLVWKFGEAACDVSGIGFSGLVQSADPKQPLRASWERSVNVHPLNTETGNSIKLVIDGWNIATERWLRHYVYERLEHTPLKNWRRGLTFVVSAFWHGLYPGYYLTFIHAALHREVAGMARKRIRPRVLALPARFRPQLVYNIITSLLTVVTVNYCFSSFTMLSWHDAIAVWNNTYWIGHWQAYAGLIILLFIPKVRSSAEITVSKKTH